MTDGNPVDENWLQEVRQLLARWVCNQEVSPLWILDQHGAFKSFSDTLNPNFHCNLSLRLLEQDCLNIYEEQQQKAKGILSKLDGRISISVASLLLEKSLMSQEDHLSVIAHFVDADWKLRKWVIKHCVDKLSTVDIVLEALKDWNIEGKIISLTGDSGVGHFVKEDIQGRHELLLNGQLFHVYSNCDVISQMVQSAFKMIRDIINKVQLLAWSKSLPLWYLTTFKLRSALELEDSGDFAPEKIGDDYEIPSEEEWGKVRSVCRIIDRVYEITKPVYEAKKQTANLYLPQVIEIHAYLVQESGSSDQFVKALTEKMLETYTVYWNDMYLMLSIAAFMDPRYKMRLVEVSSPKLLSEEKTAYVLGTIRKLYDSYVLVENNENWPFKSDLDLYLEEPVLPWTEHFSVLRWWKNNCVKYPRLSMMARDFLAVPMSLATSYEAYYTEPRPAERSVASLRPELVNALMCTRSWKFSYNH